jgi:hypothetical protein
MKLYSQPSKPDPIIPYHPAKHVCKLNNSVPEHSLAYAE